jgi:hypothetical protein
MLLYVIGRIFLNPFITFLYDPLEWPPKHFHPEIDLDLFGFGNFKSRYCIAFSIHFVHGCIFLVWIVACYRGCILVCVVEVHL